MPFHLDYFMGGLGNQIFQITTLLSLAKKYNTTFSFPLDTYEIHGLTGKIKIYQAQIFSTFRQSHLYKEKDNTLSEYRLNVIQFKDIVIDENIIINTNIIISGLPMLLSLFENDIDDIRKLLHQKKEELKYYLPKTNNTKICIGFRTFDEEGHNEWMVIHSYYRDALIKVLNELQFSNIELHIFTDRKNVSTNIILPILKELNREDIPYFEYVGKRDGITDVEHFYLMMDCEHYIICNSTFHYWPAIISKSNSIVTCSQYIQNGSFIDWFINNLVPSGWIQL